jgi:hypothetical protein
VDVTTHAEWVELEDPVLESAAGFFSVVLAVAAGIVSAGVRVASSPVRAPPVGNFAAALAFPLPFSVCELERESARTFWAEVETEFLPSVSPCASTAAVVSEPASLLVWLASSTLEPREASSDCQLERKLSTVEAVDDDRSRVTAPVSLVPCANPRALSWLGAGPLPASISIPAAMAMQPDKAEDMPNSVGDKLEHCHK